MKKKCAVYNVANFIGKRWTILILLELFKGKSKWKRYSELKKRLLNITPKILSSRLKELEKEKLIVKRVSIKRFSIKSEYRLTESGKDFINVIKNIKKWSLKWKGNSKTCEETDCKDCKF
jgi:DNA-binding HxlR family transcriptional regulator